LIATIYGADARLIKKQLLLILATATVALVTACGGGGGGSVAPGASAGAPTSPPTLPPGSNATSGPMLQMALTVTIPGKKSSSRARGPQYIAPNSGSMSLTLLTVNGAAVQSTAQGPFNLVPGPTNPNCVAGTNTTCTFTISAPVGTDIFLANTFAAGSGAALGSGAVLVNVRQNATNSANLSLTGPVASVQVVSAATSLYNGNPAPAPSNSDESLLRGSGSKVQAAHQARIAALSRTNTAAARRGPAGAAPTPTPFGPTVTTARIFVIALDAAGNQIINPTTYDIPINLTLSLNGLPAGAVTLTVTYAGLPGEGAPASTSSDQGVVTVLAPADAITMTLTGTSTQTSALAPTVVANYTPQGGTLQASTPLTFSVLVPPAAAVLNASASHIDPLTVGVAANMTDAFLNIGTAPTNGQIEAQGWFPSNLTYNGTGPGSDPSWVCGAPNNYGPYFEVDCLSNAVVPPNGSIPIVFNVTPNSGTSAYNELDVFGGNAINANFDVFYVDNINIGSGPALALGNSVANNAFYATVAGVYQLFVTNPGTAATAGTITLVDTLPTNFTYNSFAGAPWACGAAGQTVTCTYAPSLAASGGAAPELDLNVTPAQTITDTFPSNSVSVSGGGASAIGPQTLSNVYISSPVQFTSTGFSTGPTYGNAFAAGDGATFELGAVPTPGPVDGSFSITTQSAASSSYSIVGGSDNCQTNSISDGTFEGLFPATADSVGLPVVLNFNVEGQTGPNSCSLSIQDVNGNTATLNISIDQTGVTVQGHRQKAVGAHR
jgi:hypothetical protein